MRTTRPVFIVSDHFFQLEDENEIWIVVHANSEMLESFNGSYVLKHAEFVTIFWWFYSPKWKFDYVQT